MIFVTKINTLNGFKDINRTESYVDYENVYILIRTRQ